MSNRLPLMAGRVVLCAGLVLGTSCSRPRSWTEPGPVTAARTQSATSALEGLTFQLLDGDFAITARGEDGIVGTYTGSSTFSGSGRQTSALTLQVNDGSGAFAGASGSVTVAGTGAFADEGTFVLEGNGELTLAGGRRVMLVLNLRGSATASCSPGEQIAITQSASGTLGRVGRVEARLSHVVSGTGCSS